MNKTRLQFLLLILLLLVAAIGTTYMFRMPGKSFSNNPPPLSPNEQQMRARMKSHVQKLAGSIGERNMFNFEALEEAKDYIIDELNKIGGKIVQESYSLGGKLPTNVIFEVPGSDKSDQIIIIGAHYDSVQGSYGANDNATGVAGLLELARHFAHSQPNRTLRFAFFVNEEPPFFTTPQMGSRVYVKRLEKDKENIVGMLSLETIGFFSNKPKSQQYPFPFSYFYPDTGNFIAFVSNIASRKLLFTSIDAFRKHASIPSEGVYAPGWIPGVDWSDQWSFWQSDYPAIMVTDTALYRYPYYHTYQDTPDKVDYDGLSRVVSGLKPVVSTLARNTL